MVAPPSTQGAAVHPPLLRPGEGGRPPVLRGTGAGPSLPGLRSRAVVVPSSLHNDHAAIAAGARHVPVGRTVLVESVCRRGGGYSGTVPTGRGSRDDSRESTAGIRGVGSPSKSRAWLSPQLYREHARTTETVVGALRSHVYLRHSATTCGLELAHAAASACIHSYI